MRSSNAICRVGVVNMVSKCSLRALRFLKSKVIGIVGRVHGHIPRIIYVLGAWRSSTKPEHAAD